MVSHKKTKKKSILMMRIKKLALKESDKLDDDLYLNDNIEVYLIANTSATPISYKQ